MKGILYSVRMLFVPLLILAPTLAFAGLVQLPQTGQTTCWDASGVVVSCSVTGQDGDLQAGAAWPNPRFTDNGDQTITDNLTGLIWTKDGNAPGPTVCGPGTNKGWQSALDYIKCLNTNNYLGYNDWRLPNIIELESLLHTGQSNSATWLNTQGISNVQSDYTSNYWSSSTYTYRDAAWTVNMYYGNVSYNGKSNYSYVWPVRTGQSVSSGSSIISLPRTGQTTCYDTNGSSIACTGTGQDGELQMGAIWPNPRFTDNGDQTITDNLTGLIWTKDGNAPGPAACSTGYATSWQGALDYVKCLNTNNYLGYNDWRLPNRKELRSLINTEQSNSSNWLNTQGYDNIQAFCWSSNTGAIDYICSYCGAWYVNIQYGFASTYKKSDSIGVWPVRSGQSVSFASLIILKSGIGSGTVTSDPPGINCGSICNANFSSGQSVTLTATPDAGSTFSGWSGDSCSGTGQCTITMDASKVVTMTFTPNLTVTKSGTGTGTVSSTPAGINCGSLCTSPYSSGTTVTLTATPDASSTFSGWSGSGCSGTGECMVTMDASKAVTANFTLKSCLLTVTRAGEGSGTVTPSTGTLSWSGNSGNATYPYGTSITLTAIPSSYSNFDGWSGGECAGSGSCTFTMNGDKSVMMTFSLTDDILHGDIDGDGQVDLTDAVLAMQLVAGIVPAPIVFKQTDVNGDGKIGLVEAICILQSVAGMRCPDGSALPATPTGVAVTPGNAQAIITWAAVPGATFYDIYWSTNSGVGVNGNQIAGATSPYTHTGLTNGITYYYVVVAANGNCRSSASLQKSCTPSQTPPPTGVQVIPGNGQSTISWTPVPGANSYNIYWSTDPFVTPANGTKLTHANSPYTQTGLSNGTTYYYIVTAVFTEGESAASTEVSAKPLVTPPPQTPPIIFVLPNPLGTVAQCSYFSYQIGNVTGGAGAPYTFNLGTMGGFPPLGIFVNAGGLIEGVASSPAGAYSFEVCVTDAAFTQKCYPTSMTVTSPVSPGTPSGPFPANGATGVPLSPTLTWAATSNTNSYNVYYGTSFPPPLVANVAGPSYSDLAPLNPDTTYYWQIIAIHNMCNFLPPTVAGGPVWSFTTRALSDLSLDITSATCVQTWCAPPPYPCLTAQDTITIRGTACGPVGAYFVPGGSASLDCGAWGKDGYSCQRGPSQPICTNWVQTLTGLPGRSYSADLTIYDYSNNSENTQWAVTCPPCTCP